MSFLQTGQYLHLRLILKLSTGRPPGQPYIPSGICSQLCLCRWPDGLPCGRTRKVGEHLRLSLSAVRLNFVISNMPAIAALSVTDQLWVSSELMYRHVSMARQQALVDPSAVQPRHVPLLPGMSIQVRACLKLRLTACGTYVHSRAKCTDGTARICQAIYRA